MIEDKAKKKCDFIRAMFVSYGVVATFFFVMPFTFVMFLSFKVFFDLVKFFIMLFGFLGPVFLVGYFLAPVVGPLCGRKKGFSLCMSLFSMLLGSLFFLLTIFLLTPGFTFLNKHDIEFVITLFFFAVAYGLVPSFFSAVFFSGKCERINNLKPGSG